MHHNSDLAAHYEFSSYTHHPSGPAMIETPTDSMIYIPIGVTPVGNLGTNYDYNSSSDDEKVIDEIVEGKSDEGQLVPEKVPATLDKITSLDVTPPNTFAEPLDAAMTPFIERSSEVVPLRVIIPFTPCSGDKCDPEIEGKSDKVKGVIMKKDETNHEDGINNKRTRRIKCYCCASLNHKANDCWYRYPNKAPVAWRIKKAIDLARLQLGNHYWNSLGTYYLGDTRMITRWVPRGGSRRRRLSRDEVK